MNCKAMEELLKETNLFHSSIPVIHVKDINQFFSFFLFFLPDSSHIINTIWGGSHSRDHMAVGFTTTFHILIFSSAASQPNVL
jgi:hypothetical protein